MIFNATTRIFTTRFLRKSTGIFEVCFDNDSTTNEIGSQNECFSVKLNSENIED